MMNRYAAADTESSSEEEEEEEFSIETFRCFICLRKAHRPTITRCCTKLVCYKCIKKWISGHQTCPHCRKRLLMTDIIDVARLVSGVSDVCFFVRFLLLTPFLRKLVLWSVDLSIPIQSAKNIRTISLIIIAQTAKSLSASTAPFFPQKFVLFI